MNKPKDAAEVRAEFEQAGVSIGAWADANGFDRHDVYRVLKGASANYGKAHRIAVALGLKNGVVVDVAKFKPAAQAVNA